MENIPIILVSRLPKPKKIFAYSSSFNLEVILVVPGIKPIVAISLNIEKNK
ncbi:MAG: hypothetical protein L6U99_02630 [Clostridium sp.]|nr:MAG: hypothetical protein L6U99_02630 [Clostridium sp.]